MQAVVTDSEIDCIINMPNEGQISNLPLDVVVEALGTVGHGGIQPKSSGDLPGSAGSLCRLHADVHDLSVRASLQSSRELLVEALSLDPLSVDANFSELPKLADELIEANTVWLPRIFN